MLVADYRDSCFLVARTTSIWPECCIVSTCIVSLISPVAVAKQYSNSEIVLFLSLSLFSIQTLLVGFIFDLLVAENDVQPFTMWPLSVPQQKIIQSGVLSVWVLRRLICVSCIMTCLSASHRSLQSWVFKKLLALMPRSGYMNVAQFWPKRMCSRQTCAVVADLELSWRVVARVVWYTQWVVVRRLGCLTIVTQKVWHGRGGVHLPRNMSFLRTHNLLLPIG